MQRHYPLHLQAEHASGCSGPLPAQSHVPQHRTPVRHSTAPEIYRKNTQYFVLPQTHYARKESYSSGGSRSGLRGAKLTNVFCAVNSRQRDVGPAARAAQRQPLVRDRMGATGRQSKAQQRARGCAHVLARHGGQGCLWVGDEGREVLQDG